MMMQARADAECAQATLEKLRPAGDHPIRKFAKAAGERIRIDGGGYRREHLHALAQRSRSRMASWDGGKGVGAAPGSVEGRVDQAVANDILLRK
jgi:hypothetical protein